MKTETFWTLLTAVKEGDPNDQDSPTRRYTVETGGLRTHFIVRNGETQVGRVDKRDKDRYDICLKTESFGQMSRVTFQDLTFRDATEVIVSFLQGKDLPFVEACDKPPGERVLSTAFGKLVDCWREWPKDPTRMPLDKWKSAAQGALVAESVAVDYSRDPKLAGTLLPFKIGLRLREYHSELLDREVEEIFTPEDETGEAFAEEMERITGSRPPTLEEEMESITA